MTDHVEQVARALAPHLAGYVEFDAMPKDRAETRQRIRDGVPSANINDATQGDALEAARAAIAALPPDGLR